MSMTALVLAAAAATALAPGVYADGDNRLDVVALSNGDRAIAVYATRAYDHNSGFIAGTLRAGSAAFVNDAAGTKCSIAFAVRGKHVTMTQDRAFGDCGFGYGVLADGIYTFVPGAKPSLTDPRGG